MSIRIIHAIQALLPKAECSVKGDDCSGIVWFDKREQPTDKQITDKLAELRAEYDAQEYARNRETEYPSNGDQWDMIYKDNKNSTTTHATAVEAVKTKWPKDNSGPVE